MKHIYNWEIRDELCGWEKPLYFFFNFNFDIFPEFLGSSLKCLFIFSSQWDDYDLQIWVFLVACSIHSGPFLSLIWIFKQKPLHLVYWFLRKIIICQCLRFQVPAKRIKLTTRNFIYGFCICYPIEFICLWDIRSITNFVEVQKMSQLIRSRFYHGISFIMFMHAPFPSVLHFFFLTYAAWIRLVSATVFIYDNVDVCIYI